MHTDHARVSVVIAVHHTLAHQRITDRRVHKIRKRPHFLVCLGDHRAAAHIDKRLFRVLQKAYRLRQFFLSIAEKIVCCRFHRRIDAFCRNSFRIILQSGIQNCEGT